MRDEAHPSITVRLHPDALTLLKERAEKALPGPQGGMGAYIRTLLYDHLDFDSVEWELYPRCLLSPE